MLPPIEQSILENNPKFGVLHATLSKTILDSNGASRNAHTKEHDAVKEEYRLARLRAARSQLVKTAICELDLSTPPTVTVNAATISQAGRKVKDTKSATQPLPSELVELVILLSADIKSSPLLPPSKLRTLRSSPAYLSLPNHLPQLSELLSSHLQIRALALTRIQFPSTNASYLHRSTAKVVPSVEDVKARIENTKRDLEKRRIDLVGKVNTVLGLYHLASSLIILHLEQTVHGSLARHIKAKSEYLSLTAQELLAETQEKKRRAETLVYTEEVKSALANYMMELKAGRERLLGKKKEVERVLWGYGIGRREGEGGEEKERTMRKIAEKYVEVKKEVEDVTRDVERLKGG